MIQLFYKTYTTDSMIYIYFISDISINVFSKSLNLYLNYNYYYIFLVFLNQEIRIKTLNDKCINQIIFL